MNRVTVELTPYVPAADLFRLVCHQPDCAFLDSSLVNDLGRWSIIGLKPYETFVKEHDGTFTRNGQPQTGISFEDSLQSYLRTHQDENQTGLPMVSGAIGYFSYDYGRENMGVASQEADPEPIPQARVVFYDLLVIEDCRDKRVWLSACGVTEPAKILLDRFQEQIDQAARQGFPPVPTGHASRPIDIRPNFEKEEYKAAVDRMIRYIIEGDIYIANMTQRLDVASDKDPLSVFYYLREHNPSPFGGYLDCGDHQIVCASPERFLQLKDGLVQTRPIKGTRKRGDTPEEDAALRLELEQSEKDKSELLMIVDLERNDLNRVCRPGSVKVTELFTVEAYATVFHLVSNIQGQLAEGMDVTDLLKAAFPGGSITGAPKYRAMEIIDELEHGKRGLYTGSIGYLTLDGACDLNIVIRTALHRDGRYHLGVGGGITAESDLEFEYEETLQKARAVLEALA
jgi:para-aminobenzoate synthetase component 1